MLPFGKEELDYISRLDAKADIRMLRTEVRESKQTTGVRGEAATWLGSHALVWLWWDGGSTACGIMLPMLAPAPRSHSYPPDCLTPLCCAPPPPFLTLPQVPSLRVESLRVLEVCTTLLKACAAAGLTLAEIAGVVTRPLIGMEEEPSELERICFNARAEVRWGGGQGWAGLGCGGTAAAGEVDSHFVAASTLC